MYRIAILCVKLADAIDVKMMKIPRKTPNNDVNVLYLMLYFYKKN
jgi:hypothetical protein